MADGRHRPADGRPCGRWAPAAGGQERQAQGTAAEFHAGSPGLYPAGRGTARGLGSPYSSNTDTTFVSEAEAPAASVTVTVIVKLRGRMMTYVCPAENVPSLETFPLSVVPSPQLIV